MADSWLTHAEYLTYGYEVISEEEFPQLAAKATLQIMEATHWRAAAAKDEACIHSLTSSPSREPCPAIPQTQGSWMP